MTMKCMMCGKQKSEDDMMKDGKGHLQPVCSDCVGKAAKQMGDMMTMKDKS